MAYVQDKNRFAVDGEQNLVDVRLASVEQVPYLKGKLGVFRGERAKGGEGGKRGDGFFQSLKPPQAGFSRVL